MTGSGGWPLTAFLTPDGRPFFAGTYFPPVPPHGLPSFRQVLTGIAQAWTERRDEVVTQGAQIAEHIARVGLLSASQEPLTDEIARTRVLAAAPGVRRRARRLRRRAEVPAADDAGVRAAVRAARLEPATRSRSSRPRSIGWPTAASTTTSAAGSHRYSTDAALARAALREDALRQRAARTPVRARVAGDAATTDIARVADRDARVPAARDAARRGRVLLVAGRRQRGRRGQVLRLVVGRVRRAASEPSAVARAASARRPRATGRGRTCCGGRAPSARSPRSTGWSRTSSCARLEDAGSCSSSASERVKPATDDKVLTAWNALAIARSPRRGRAFGEPSYVVRPAARRVRA